MSFTTTHLQPLATSGCPQGQGFITSPMGPLGKVSSGGRSIPLSRGLGRPTKPSVPMRRPRKLMERSRGERRLREAWSLRDPQLWPRPSVMVGISRTRWHPVVAGRGGFPSPWAGVLASHSWLWKVHQCHPVQVSEEVTQGTHWTEPGCVVVAAASLLRSGPGIRGVL